MFDVVALEKDPICASHEQSRLIITQFEPGFTAYDVFVMKILPFFSSGPIKT